MSTVSFTEKYKRMTKLSFTILFYIFIIVYAVFCAPFVNMYNPRARDTCNALEDTKSLIIDPLLDKNIDVKPMGYEEEQDDELDLKSQAVRSKKQTKLWDHWGKWSSCSVSCGVGKMTRWRHCVSDGCSPGEKEAQIKTCTEPPC